MTFFARREIFFLTNLTRKSFITLSISSGWLYNPVKNVRSKINCKLFQYWIRKLLESRPYPNPGRCLNSQSGTIRGRILLRYFSIASSREVFCSISESDVQIILEKHLVRLSLFCLWRNHIVLTNCVQLFPLAVSLKNGIWSYLFCQPCNNTV